MRVLVPLAVHYLRGPDGRTYTDGPNRYSFWLRYLQVFDQVRVLARVRRADEIDPSWARADGDGVSFGDLSQHTGPWEYWKVRSRLRRETRQAVDQCDAFIIRTGGAAVPNLVWRELRRRRLPYAVEVTGDPWDILGPGTLNSWSRPIGRWAYYRNLRNHCRYAAAALYVTREALQARYPPSLAALAVGCSDVDMPPDAFVSQARRFVKPASRLVYVGTLQQFYKCPDILVQAVAACVQRGMDLKLRILGDGQRRGDLEQLIRSLDLGDRVELLGQIAERDAVLRELDAADVFVLASRQEGLPRAMVEAMGRGLPCIGSTTGGIPELLASENLVTPGDVAALSGRIEEFLSDVDRLTRESARNLQTARGYSAAILEPRRTEFYEYVRDLFAKRRPEKACVTGA